MSPSIEIDALPGRSLDRSNAEPALQNFAIQAAAGEQGQGQMRMVALTRHAIEVDRREGEIDALQCLVERIQFIGLETGSAFRIETKFNF